MTTATSLAASADSDHYFVEIFRFRPEDDEEQPSMVFGLLAPDVQEAFRVAQASLQADYSYHPLWDNNHFTANGLMAYSGIEEDSGSSTYVVMVVKNDMGRLHTYGSTAEYGKLSVANRTPGPMFMAHYHGWRTASEAYESSGTQGLSEYVRGTRAEASLAWRGLIDGLTGLEDKDDIAPDAREFARKIGRNVNELCEALWNGFCQSDQELYAHSVDPREWNRVAGHAGELALRCRLVAAVELTFRRLAQVHGFEPTLDFAPNEAWSLEEPSGPHEKRIEEPF